MFKPADADRVFATLFRRFESQYAQRHRAYEKHFRRIGIRDAMHDVLNKRSATTGLRSLAALAARINPDAGRRYAEFLRREILVEILP